MTDPKPQSLHDNLLSEDGAYVVGLRRDAGGYILVTRDGHYSGCDDELTNMDIAARFMETHAHDVAFERGLKVFEIVASAGRLQLKPAP